MAALSHRLFGPLTALLLLGPAGLSPAGLIPSASAQVQAQTTLLRPQAVAPLPGSLDGVLVLNDNNPELITAAGILLSTFPAAGRAYFTSISSTRKWRVALGGITPPAPRAP